ncbi:MAG: ABC transporter permease [Chloroflexi bacterium RBG_19FT_COMBO_47_15]|nr:MAG: ABC transporter permease [Chloroflexi bacterium RBG_19FT_COMBO_47_15]
MSELWEAFLQAIQLIVTLNSEVVEIALRSLAISATAVVLASLICIPVGGLIHFRNFQGKRVLINVIQTFYSIPTVCIGLFVFIFISRAGPLGGLNLLFTPTAVVIGQMVLITPILMGLTISALSGVDKAIKDSALSSGATEFQAISTIMKEARFAVVAAFIMGFGRAISEVGAAMMLGGNIRGYTRILTTAISLETQKGELVLALALGIILIALALVINIIVNVALQRY